jgi:aryl-alcohol dehydrogenase-like predicted oxidoreductase
MSFSGIALGCGNFGGVGSAPEFFGQGISEEEAGRIMDRAWENGIQWFDTADAYGGGRSESYIGRWCMDRGHAPVLTTKVFHSTVGNPDDVGLSPQRIRRQIESSLARLGRRIDLYLAHEPDPHTPLGDTIACFERLQQEGLIGAWGLSNYDAAGIAEALRYGRPALVQNAFSLLDREDETNGVLELCRANGIPYVPFGPLSGGWLTGKYRRGEAFPAGSRMTQRPGPYERLVNDRVFDGLERLQAEADERVVDMATLAFAWVLARVDGAVAGPTRAEQLYPVLAARELSLSAAAAERIGSFFE